MNGQYAITQEKSIDELVPEPSAAEIVAELEKDHRHELKKLSDLSFLFLAATNGNPWHAENLLDDAIELLFEGGVLSTWRYRILLSAIREGL